NRVLGDQDLATAQPVPLVAQLLPLAQPVDRLHADAEFGGGLTNGHHGNCALFSHAAVQPARRVMPAQLLGTGLRLASLPRARNSASCCAGVIELATAASIC